MAQDFFTEVTARTLYFDGTKYAENSNGVLEAIAERLPHRKVAIHAQVALAMPMTKPYKLLGQDGRIHIKSSLPQSNKPAKRWPPACWRTAILPPIRSGISITGIIWTVCPNLLPPGPAIPKPPPKSKASCCKLWRIAKCGKTCWPTLKKRKKITGACVLREKKYRSSL